MNCRLEDRGACTATPTNLGHHDRGASTKRKFVLKSDAITKAAAPHRVDLWRLERALLPVLVLV